MILMRLVEEGVLNLSDNPQDHLSFWTESADDARSRITLAHLLSFTSGFEGSTGLGAQEGVACIEDAETTIEACAEAIFASGLLEDGGYFAYEPGTTFYYRTDSPPYRGSDDGFGDGTAVEPALSAIRWCRAWTCYADGLWTTKS